MDLDFILNTEDDNSDQSADTVNPTTAASERGTAYTKLDADASSVSVGAGVGVGSGAETGAPLVCCNDGDDGPVVEASTRQSDVLRQSAVEGAAVETSIGQYVNIVGWAKQIYCFYSQILSLKGLSIGSLSLAYSLLTRKHSF